MKNIKIKEIETKNILTKSNLPISDYSVNPYVGCTHACKYCYACFIKRFTNHNENWGEFLDVKYWPKLKNKEKYEGKEFFIGSSTDPYNPQEKIYERTKAFLEEIKDIDARVSIQTKSDLVLRDLDLIKSFKNIRIGFSINTLDEEFRKDMDEASPIEKRIEAMKKLHEEKIQTTCFISPIFPGITDVVAIIEKVKDYANLIWLENLNLRGNYKKVILDYIKEKYPHLVNLYEDIYIKNNKSYWENLNLELKKYASDNNLEYVRDDDSMQKTYLDKPTIVNYFYHEEVKKSAKKK